METPKDFLNPSSMTTPGMAGALAMTVANTVSCQFGLAEPWPAAIALAMSFVCGLLVLTAKAMPLWRRLAYYVVNSLIIFTVAVGSNTLGQTAAAPTPSDHSARPAMAWPHLADMVGITPAQAQPTENGWCCLNTMIKPSTAQECEKWAGRFFTSAEAAQQACQANDRQEQPQQQRFFRPWFQNR